MSILDFVKVVVHQVDMNIFFLSHLRLLRYIVSYMYNVLLNSFIFTSSVFPVSKLFPSCTYHSQGQSVHCL